MQVLLPSLPIFHSLTPRAPQAVHFPTFNELLSQPAPEQKEQRDGLFNSLVRDPAILYLEYLEHPDMFEEETAHLLQSLVGQQKKVSDLTEAEMKKLDEAVVSYAQYHPPKKETLAPVESTPEFDDDEPDIEWGPEGPLAGANSAYSQIPDGVLHRWWGET